MKHRWLAHAPGHVACGPENFEYRTDLPVAPAAAVREIHLNQGITVQLRVTPDQHQVVVSHADEQWVETVRPSPDTDTAPLPVLRNLVAPTSFASEMEAGCTVTKHSERGLRRELRKLHETMNTAALALCIQDTETPEALTAVTCYLDQDTSTLLWWTWHVLPETGDVIRTRARLRLNVAASLRAA